MNHMGTVKIETQRLLLRQFEEKDIVAAFNNWTSDEKVTEYLRWPTHKSIKTTESVLKEWINLYDNKDFYQWAIVFKEYGDLPIGTISVVDKNEVLNIAHIGAQGEATAVVQVDNKNEHIIIYEVGSQPLDYYYKYDIKKDKLDKYSIEGLSTDIEQTKISGHMDTTNWSAWDLRYTSELIGKTYYPLRDIIK